MAEFDTEPCEGCKRVDDSITLLADHVSHRECCYQLPFTNEIHDRLRVLTGLVGEAMEVVGYLAIELGQQVRPADVYLVAVDVRANAPAYTFVCWLYCSTYDVLWSNTAYVIALFGIVTTILVVRHQDKDRYAFLGFGFLALPLGLPALYEGYRRMTRPET
nr:hypothetical protein [Halostella sp. PRR32]